MKSILLLFCIILSFVSSKGQQKVFQDSLAQFSYLLYGSTVLNKENQVTKVQGRQATGFFIKKNKRIYFVTAKHAVTNYLTESEKTKEFPERYNVYSHYSDQFDFIPLPPVWITAKSRNKGGLNGPDIFVHEVTDKLSGFPISIVDLGNNDADLIPTKKEYGEIRFFGFPENMNWIEKDLIQISPPYLFTTKNFTIAENFLNQIGNEIGIDSLRYEVQIKDLKVNAGLAGFSGAPVFIKNGQTNKWEFLGVLVGINEIKNSIYVVNRDKILSQIIELSL